MRPGAESRTRRRVRPATSGLFVAVAETMQSAAHPAPDATCGAGRSTVARAGRVRNTPVRTEVRPAASRARTAMR